MTPAIEPKKVEKVVTGEVTLRKKPLSKRVLDTFFGGNPHGVMGFVLSEVVVPAMRSLLVEAFSNGVERMVYGGDSPTPNRRGGYRPSGQANYVQYNRFAPSHQPNRYARDEPREISRRGRSTHDTDEIVFQTHAEAREVLVRMFDLINEYEQVTLSDLYSMVDITGNYTDETHGWTDIRGTEIRRARGGGYILDLPPTQVLKP